MIAVIFESQPHPEQKDAYLEAGARLRSLVEHFDGFISIERFESLAQPGKLLALSFWRDEESVNRWRNMDVHRRIQGASRKTIFADYRLCVASVLRDYTMTDRAGAPEDSRLAHDAK